MATTPWVPPYFGSYEQLINELLQNPFLGSGRPGHPPVVAEMARTGGTPTALISCLSWKWRERSAVKITGRTHEEATEALQRRRESRHSEAAFA
ncbi:MAG: hypothetical protein ACR2IV_12345, partial [Bryobacteraceae bacterium]